MPPRAVFRRLVPLAALATALAAAAPARGARSLRWDRIEVRLELDAGGDLRVEERLGYVLDGAWNGGERGLPLGVVRAYDAISVEEVDRGRYRECDLARVGCFAVFRSPGRVLVRWRSRAPDAPPYRDAHLTFVLRYTARGVLRRLSARLAELRWNCVFPDRPGPIGAAEAVLRLPSTVDPGRVRAQLGTHAAHRSVRVRPDGTVLAAAGPLEPGDAMQLLALLPAEGLELPPVPAPRAPAAGRVPTPARSGLPLVAGIVLAAAAYLAVRVARTVRLPAAPAVAEPPEGVPPALAAALVEGGPRRILTAALLELARRGVVGIEARERRGLLRPRPDPVLVRLSSAEELERWEYELLAALGLFPTGTRIRPREREVRRRLGHRLERILETVQHGLRRRDLARMAPGTARLLGAWVTLQLGIAVAVAVAPPLPLPLGIAVTLAAATLAAIALGAWRRRGCPPRPIAHAPYLAVAALALLAGWGVGLAPGRVLASGESLLGWFGAAALCLLGLVLPLVEWRSPRGMAARARLHGLRRALRHLRDLGALQEARRRFEELLPYATALGMERPLLAALPAAAEAVPGWYRSGRIADGSGGAVAGAAPPGANGGLQGLSDGLAATLSALSSSLAGAMGRGPGGAGGPSASGSGGGGGGSGGGW